MPVASTELTKILLLVTDLFGEIKEISKIRKEDLSKKNGIHFEMKTISINVCKM